MQRLPRAPFPLNKLILGIALIAVLIFYVKEYCCHMVVSTPSDDERAVVSNVDLSNGASHRA